MTSTPTSLSINDIVVGKTRICDVDGFVGTIMYVGPVASAKKSSESYIGIVWDDGSRGKHDGSVICRTTNQLVRHFQAPSSTSGSFLKLGGKAKIDWGVTLSKQLIQEKYTTMEAPLEAPNNILPHTVQTVRGHAKPIEFLGELKVREMQQLSNLHLISLRSMRISRIGLLEKEEDIDAYEYGHITEMDLAGNLLSDWTTHIFPLFSKFPNLKSLSLASNRIQDFVSSSSPQVYPKLQILNLNNCGISTFQTVLHIAKIMPNLEEICFSNSNLSDVTQQLEESDAVKMMNMTVKEENEDASNKNNYQLDSATFFPKLRLLDCTNCQLTCWDTQVVKFAALLPNLQHLVLNDNFISSITPPHTTASSKEEEVEGLGNGGTKLISNNKGPSENFPSLVSIQLSGTSPTSWMDLEGLQMLPKLENLRLQNTPITSCMGTGESRSIIIARFPSLKMLNGSTISSKERVEAERRYVSNIARDLLLMANHNTNNGADDGDDDDNKDSESLCKEQQQQNFLAQHPQFDRLREKHQETMMIVHGTSSFANGGGIATAGAGGIVSTNVVLNVNIQSMAASSCSVQPLTKRLPCTLTVGRLKLLCRKAFGLDVDLQTLHFKNSMEDDPFPIELDNDANSLAYYGVCDGATIYMNEIDLKGQQQQQEQLQKQQQLQMAKQEQEIESLQQYQRNNNIQTQQATLISSLQVQKEQAQEGK